MENKLVFDGDLYDGETKKYYVLFRLGDDATVFFFQKTTNNKDI